MATDEATICNLALNGIGVTAFISDLAEDSNEANICRLVYPQARDEELEVTAPGWATARVRPAPIDETTLALGEVPGGWKYAYALPDDALPNGLRSVYPGIRSPRDDQQIRFAVEWDSATQQVVVLTDQEDPEYVYTARITDPARFPATFARAIAERMAKDLIRGLRKDLRLLEAQRRMSGEASGTAAASAGRASKPDPEPENFITAARR
ncbi:MAG TPA: hypothetical protein VGI97_00620 [Gemmatimonadaceae bacterium]|jgi:hypothetical protein